MDPASPPDAPRPGVAARCRQALRDLGGIASARAIAARVEADGGGRLGTRRVKEALRGGEVCSLGGGYLALDGGRSEPLLPWLLRRLERAGPLPVEAVVTLALGRWPHGDPRAIEAWLRQDPRGLVVVDGVVRAPRVDVPRRGPRG